MSFLESDLPIQRYQHEQREAVLDFLRQVDDRFVPPLSSAMRYGSLENYLDYSLADGQGRILLYVLHGRIVGFMAFRYEAPVAGSAAPSIYLSNMCVTESLMGTVLAHLFRAMVHQVDQECGAFPSRIWARTWLSNRASARTLQRLGLDLVETIPEDPVFQGCRDTLVFEAKWQTFVRNVQQLSSLRGRGDSSLEAHGVRFQLPDV